MNIKYIASTIFLLSALLTNEARAQKNEMQWVFGYHAGLDFTSGTPVPFQSAIEGFGEGNASVCDANGKLLFYTEGSFVWDRNNRLMPNGSNLTGLSSTTSYSVTSSASQGTLIIPMPGDTTKYFVFSLSSMEQNSVGKAGRLYYSIIDMTLNGGLGDVVPDKKGIFIDSALSERMTAVVGDRCNIWVICCSIEAKIKAYEIDFSVVKKEPVVSNVGIRQEFTGYLVVSPDGKKIAATKCYVFGGGNDGVSLFDFDISTGLATNPVVLMPGYGGYGVAFSPDNSKLYAAGSFQHLFQWDLTSNNATAIAASETRIGDATMTSIKLGPDGKLYLKSSDNFIGSINNPNYGGANCDYTPNVIRLAAGTSIHSGLPNQVPEFNFSKDTMSSRVSVSDMCFNNSMKLSANKEDGWTYVWSDGAQGKDHVVQKAGTYWVSYYTSPCTYNVDSFDAFFPTFYTANSCQSGASGMAAVTQAHGDTSSYTFLWRDAAGTLIARGDTLYNVPAGTYTLEVTSSKGCSTKHEIIIEADVYQASFDVDTLACVDQPVAFKNTSDAYYVNHNWYFGDGKMDGSHSPAHSFISPGAYSVMLVAYGPRCADTVYKNILVDDVIKVSLYADRDTVCQGVPATFYPKPDGDNTLLGYRWSLGDQVSFVSEAGSVSHAYEQEGLKAIQLSANFRACPEQTYRDTLYVAPFPVVNLGADSGICLNGKSVTLSNITEWKESDKYRWSNGSAGKTIEVREPGRYTLTVTATGGCVGTSFVDVRKDCYLDIPNAFSPNGDGTNDYFFPRQLISSSVTGFNMQVFNRWGQLMFETHTLDGRGWDGRCNGIEQPQGVYIFVIDINVPEGRPEHYRGNVTVIR